MHGDNPKTNIMVISNSWRYTTFEHNVEILFMCWQKKSILCEAFPSILVGIWDCVHGLTPWFEFHKIEVFVKIPPIFYQLTILPFHSKITYPSLILSSISHIWKEDEIIKWDITWVVIDYYLYLLDCYSYI